MQRHYLGSIEEQLMKFRIALALLLLIPLSVNAEEIISFNCKKEDNSYICDVVGKTNEYINAIDFKVLLPSYIESSEFILKDNYFGSSDNNWVSIIFDDKIRGSFEIGTLKIKTKKELDSKDIKVENLIIVNENLEEIKIDNSDKKSVNSDKSFSVLTKIIFCCVIIIIGVFIYFIMSRKGVYKR